MAQEKSPPMTTPGSHVATHRGYADGKIIEPGEIVPHGYPVAEEWMAPAETSSEA